MLYFCHQMIPITPPNTPIMHRWGNRAETYFYRPRRTGQKHVYSRERSPCSHWNGFKYSVIWAGWCEGLKWVSSFSLASRYVSFICAASSIVLALRTSIMRPVRITNPPQLDLVNNLAGVAQNPHQQNATPAPNLLVKPSQISNRIKEVSLNHITF